MKEKTTQQYFTSNDINNFLQSNMKDIYWTGMYLDKSTKEELPLTTDHFKSASTFDFVFANIKDDKKLTHTICVTNNEFLIYSNKPTFLVKKVETNLSFEWQIFLINQKDKKYIQYICNQAEKAKQEKLEKINEELNLLQKRARELQYAKDLEQSKYNTIMINASKRLHSKKLKTFISNKDLEM